MARPTASSTLSITELEKMLQSRKSDLNTLSQQHAKLSKELKDVEAKMSALGGAGSGSTSTTATGKRMGRPPKSASASTASPASSPAKSGMTAGGRVRNAKSLVETLESVLSGTSTPMKVGDIVDAVLKSGYKTGSDNFRGIVNQTLIKERKRFSSAGRGLYSGKKK